MLMCHLQPCNCGLGLRLYTLRNKWELCSFSQGRKNKKSSYRSGHVLLHEKLRLWQGGDYCAINSWPCCFIFKDKLHLWQDGGCACLYIPRVVYTFVLSRHLDHLFIKTIRSAWHQQKCRSHDFLLHSFPSQRPLQMSKHSHNASYSRRRKFGSANALRRTRKTSPFTSQEQNDVISFLWSRKQEKVLMRKTKTSQTLFDG